VSRQYSFENIIGSSAPMRRVFEQIRAVAKWTTTVLIRGESGTGKELVASAIHYNSPRSDKPFIRLNCAALSDTLLESELFGHDKGAFTGANDHRLGRFEQADGGTLFLDEIAEISAPFQAKLLRVVQEGEFERVGSSKTRAVDVRIIAATNRNLEEDVAEGKFREDLYYRLNVMPIYMPPLRARTEDIPDLARFLATRISERQGRTLELTDCAFRLLMQHDWPGNVRELENCLERAAVMAEDGIINRDALILTGLEEKILAQGGNLVQPPDNFNSPDLDERERIVAALEHAGWVQAKAARLLGMTPRQIAYRIQQFDIKVRKI
jgi:Nif-specific regulatory protein